MFGGGEVWCGGKWCLRRPMLRHPFPLRDRSPTPDAPNSLGRLEVKLEKRLKVPSRQDSRDGRQLQSAEEQGGEEGMGSVPRDDTGYACE